jgi:adenylate cyclase
LIGSFLPKDIIVSILSGELKLKELKSIYKIDDATILFFEIKNFQSDNPIDFLNQLFSEFDVETENSHLDKIKSIESTYMVSSGIYKETPDHAAKTIQLAFKMKKKFAEIINKNNKNFECLIGINSGPIVAGILGEKKWRFDCFGDTVNLSARMKSTCDPNEIQISENTLKYFQYSKHFKEYEITPRKEKVFCKGLGLLQSYLISEKFELN